MPRYEACEACDGTGALDGVPCPVCSGNGYVTENDEVAPLLDAPDKYAFQAIDPEAPIDADLFGVSVAIEPAPKRMANRTWRLLEEMRQTAQEAIEECNAAEAATMAHKRADALATLRICDAGQAAMEGEA